MTVKEAKYIVTGTEDGWLEYDRDTYEAARKILNNEHLENKYMSNEEKKVLFNALNQILINQQRIMDGLRIDYDSYYTDSAINDTADIARNNYLKFLDEEGE